MYSLCIYVFYVYLDSESVEVIYNYIHLICLLICLVMHKRRTFRTCVRNIESEQLIFY